MTVMLPDTSVEQLRFGKIELALEQVTDLPQLARASLRDGRDPYWAVAWPSGRALMDAVATLAHQIAPHSPRRAFEGRRVLDLGCGPGGVGVLAALLGAQSTLADVRPEAIALARRNASRNGVTVSTVAFDWDAPPPGLGPFDAILAADVLYGDGMLRGVLRFVKTHLAPTGRAVLTDPMRVEPAGIAGAGRLVGLEVQSRVVQAGHTHTGGVTMYTITLR